VQEARTDFVEGRLLGAYPPARCEPWQPSRARALWVCFFKRAPPPPNSSLFPYTTLFRSQPCHQPDPVAGVLVDDQEDHGLRRQRDRKSTRLNSSHLGISYAVFCLKKKKSLVGRICMRMGLQCVHPTDRHSLSFSPFCVRS